MSARPAVALASALALACAGRPVETITPTSADLEAQVSGTAVLLQAVSVVDRDVVWVSGHGGTWGRTTDGGATWRTAVVRGADTLQFRDVHAASADVAWLLAAGTGELSRVYHTVDGGASWVLQWVNPEPDGFYDCLDFWDERRGLLYGDAVDGSLRILLTEDGGRTWSQVPDDVLPPALPGEGGFAASGTCAVTGPGGRAWIAAGNAEPARIFRTMDFGRTWSAAEVPVEAGESAGLTSVSMVDEARGTAFGGVIHLEDRPMDAVARTTDGGRTWAPLQKPPLNGPFYGGVHVPGTGGRALVGVGPGGALASMDGGETWVRLEDRSWWGIGSGGPDATWITGPDGRIARVRLR